MWYSVEVVMVGDGSHVKGREGCDRDGDGTELTGKGKDRKM